MSTNQETLAASVATPRAVIEGSPATRTEPPVSGQLPDGFEEITQALTALLDWCSDIPVLAIPWIHLKHPIHPVQLDFMRAATLNGRDRQEARGQARGVPGLGLIVVMGRFIRGVAYAGYLTARLAWLRIRQRTALQALKRTRADLLLVGWRFQEISRSSSDFYYGNLQQQLSARGIESMFLWKDPRGWGWPEAFAADPDAIAQRRLPLLSLVPLTAPYRLVWRQFRAALRLRRLARQASELLLRQVAHRASEEVLSPQTMAPGLYFWMAQDAVRWWKPHALVTLYEGHGWEQSSWVGAKAAASECITIGYQHTILLRYNIELLRKKDATLARLRPDIALCTGPRTAAMLGLSHPQTTLVPFGTPRRSQAREPQAPRPAQRTVLVLPEGHLDENVLLFTAAMQAAARLPDYRFVFRCHPVLPFERVLASLPRDPGQLPNVERSTGVSIEHDFDRSSAILYRGSSSVLYAILAGLKPLYWHHPGRHDIDPLFELPVWRARISSPEGLEDTLRRYAETDDRSIEQEWRQAADYVLNYATPIDEMSIDRLLSAIGLSGSARSA